MEWKYPSIIALKGYPFTGKTNLALDIAVHCRFCLLLILDEITPAAYSSSAGSMSRPPPAEAEKLIAQAFEVLCGQAEKQLSIGRSVIIDSLPLSRGHLDRLARLSNAATKVVTVECQIERLYAWQMRFKKQYTDNNNAACAGGAIPWYKARNWDEVTDTIKAYDKRLDEPIRGVSRLYLNVDEPVRGHHVIQTIQTLVFCQDDRHIDYHTWSRYIVSILHGYEYSNDHDHDHCGRPTEKELFSRRWVSHSSSSCKDGHRIGVFMAEGPVGYEADCLVCDNSVTGPAYACNSCQAALHKSCAELRSSCVYTPHGGHQHTVELVYEREDKELDDFPCSYCSENMSPDAWYYYCAFLADQTYHLKCAFLADA